MATREALEAVLDALKVREDSDPAWRRLLSSRLKSCANEIGQYVRADQTVDTGMGYGSVAQVPWVAVFSGRQGPREGHYPVFLFARDGSAVFLSLNQTTERQPIREIVANADRLRSALGPLPDRFGPTMDLHATTAGPRKYEIGNVASVRYPTGSIPTDAQIQEDLGRVVGWNDDLAKRSDGEAAEPPETASWIFQSSPDRFDLPGALEALGRSTWLVNQYPKQIRGGQRVYLYETGDHAGVLAVATVSSDPEMLEEDEEERRFQRKPEGFEGARLRVRLEVDEVLDHPIRRDELLADPVLATLPNLKFANATNYPVSAEQDAALRQLLAGHEDRPRPRLAPKAAEAGPLTFDWLMQTTLWPAERLEELVAALSGDGTQIVLAGPPGTGKTWVAQALARYVVRDERRRWRIVQFHPSYGYEQFIEGLRPVVKEGGIQFEPVEGIVLEMVREMRSPDEVTVLLIDEMNRANLPKVFGELMYLFEYRDEDISLQYTPRFRLPGGLRFLATMNTADRSIRSIDVALRRRFDVYECPPEPSILSTFYETHTNLVPDLIDGFSRLNEELTAALDRHHTIGHTFFMADPMTHRRLAHVWRHKIAPLIEEYFFDQPDLAATFTLESFWSVDT